MFRRPFPLGPAGVVPLSMAGYPVARSLLDTVQRPSAERVPPLLFDSAASLVDDCGEALTNDSLVAVRAEATATTVDADGNRDHFPDGSDVPIPLVAVDRSVVGFGEVLVTDETNWQYGNEQFLCNVWDAVVDDNGTVLWDESHGQYYDLSKVATFETYAESNGYRLEATNSLVDDLGDAEAAVITSPSDALTDEELTALDEFVASGGALFLHGQSDYENYDETDNLNRIAAALGLAFRFNDDQVVDAVVNDGERYRPTTDRFNDRFPYFEDRDGIGIDGEETYAVTVTTATDGDTVDVEFEDGRAESVRILDVDTPEKASNREHERIQEWEGIEEVAHLQEWAQTATQFATEELVGEIVKLSFDPGSDVRGEFGRLLCYVDYDATGDGTLDDSYNHTLVERGYARVYDGSTAKHDAALAAELEARREGRGLWAASDPANTTPVDNRSVETLFFPKPATVRSENGPIDRDRVPVVAESSATQTLVQDAGEKSPVSYQGDLPLVGVDESSNVAVVGAPLFDERYESMEGYPVETAEYGNYVFLANLIDFLASTDGDVVIEGGHGQFPVSFGYTAEDAAYFLRFLEGQGISLVGVNDVTDGSLDDVRALVVTAAPEAFADDEIEAIQAFLDGGGALLLVGTGVVTPNARATLNDLAAAVSTDLRINADRVRDEQRHLHDDPAVPVTASIDASFPLFDAYVTGEKEYEDGTCDGRWSGGELAVAAVHLDARGDDHANPNDEYVVFENVGDERLGLTGWTVWDLADHDYTFPNSFVLPPGKTVRLHTGSGTDGQTDLYWGSGTAIWNNHGDTLVVSDETGSDVLEYSI